MVVLADHKARDGKTSSSALAELTVFDSLRDTRLSFGWLKVFTEVERDGLAIRTDSAGSSLFFVDNGRLWRWRRRN